MQGPYTHSEANNKSMITEPSWNVQTGVDSAVII